MVYWSALLFILEVSCFNPAVGILRDFLILNIALSV
jgi:hypothetical protein